MSLLVMVQVASPPMPTVMFDAVLGAADADPALAV